MTETLTDVRIRPLSDHVLVEREEAQTKSKGGLYIPDTAQEKPQRGTVLAVGPGNLDPKTGLRIALQVEVGDQVLFTKWGGTEAKELGDNRVMLRESDILGVIE